ncbi:unnamed protein product [Chilo suppressalis]|uniref:FLYWCH-type domain-containing protein n=1 Tax=Chilo suppressalis TaxID=168631 RepID=A0ABN8AT71_CHISP|nr:unnamed protein product [Chilo suppressalis]
MVKKKALTTAERQRRYREKRKKYPEKVAEVKRKDLERYHTQPLQYVTSQRGKRLLLVNGYTFCRHSTYKPPKVRWVCATHSGKGCKAAAYTYNDILVGTKNEHNHRPKIDYPEQLTLEIKLSKQKS